MLARTTRTTLAFALALSLGLAGCQEEGSALDKAAEAAEDAADDAEDAADDAADAVEDAVDDAADAIDEHAGHDHG